MTIYSLLDTALVYCVLSNVKDDYTATLVEYHNTGTQLIPRQSVKVRQHTIVDYFNSNNLVSVQAVEAETIVSTHMAYSYHDS